MQRWSPEDLEPRPSPLSRIHASPGPLASTPAGLLITCSAECFPPALLDAQLRPDDWLVHRSPGAVVPPFGAGCLDEEELIAHAVDVLCVRDLVVCGHAPCSVAAHLLTADGPADDFILREWLTHAEAARQTLAALPACGPRAAAERCVLSQQANLLTHPAVAAAVALGRLRVWTWLYDAGASELLYPAAGEARFTRPAALHPDQNAGLRRDVARRRRPRAIDPWRPGLA